MIVLVTDSTAYLTAAEAAALGVMVLPMTYSVGTQLPINERYIGDNGDFEKLIRDNQTTIRTAQTSYLRFQNAFSELTNAGHQVLCMTISSRLSGTFGNAVIAARDFPGAPIRVVDSLSTGSGLYLLLRETRKQIMDGATLDEAANNAEKLRERVQIVFSVDDMEPLRRSGRLGIVKLSVSTILNIRPMLRCVDGRIESYSVVRGQLEQRRALIHTVPDDVASVVVQHLCTTERADKLAAELRACGHEVEVRRIGPVLGTHLGIGCLAVSWIDEGDNRM